MLNETFSVIIKHRARSFFFIQPIDQKAAVCTLSTVEQFIIHAAASTLPIAFPTCETSKLFFFSLHPITSTYTTLKDYLLCGKKRICITAMERELESVIKRK